MEIPCLRYGGRNRFAPRLQTLIDNFAPTIEVDESMDEDGAETDIDDDDADSHSPVRVPSIADAAPRSPVRVDNIVDAAYRSPVRDEHIADAGSGSDESPLRVLGGLVLRHDEDVQLLASLFRQYS